MTNPYLIKKSLQLAGHKTSVALELEFWQVLLKIAKQHNKTLTEIVNNIDSKRCPDKPLSTALRLEVLYFLNQSS